MRSKNKIRTYTSIIVSIFALSTIIFSETASAFTEGRYVEYIATLRASGVIQEEVDMSAPITQSQFLRFILRNSPDFNRNLKFDRPEKRFINVSNIMSYAPYAYTALKTGIIEMPADKKFNPKAKINKVKGLKMILDLYGISASRLLKLDGQYTDVQKGAWYVPYIARAMKLDLIEPEESNSFGINSNLTIKETAGILVEINNVLENQRQPKEIYLGSPNIENIDVLYDVYNKIQEFYFYDKEIDNDKLVYEAINGLVNGLSDRYSVFNTPQGTDDFIQGNSGEFQGVGMWIERTESGYTGVAGVIPDSPAEEANMKVGDLILKVNGEDIKGWSPEKVAATIKGPAGSEVTLFIEKHPDKRRINITVKRAQIEMKFVSGEIMETYYAYFDISQFPQDLKNDFNEVAAKIINDRTRGIILDLRNNPGGYVTAAEDLLSFFMHKGEIMYYLDYRETDRVAQAKATGMYADKFPVVVLTDASSASASEIVTAALKDYELAKIIGDKTFGKGVAQQLFFYDDGSSLKLTIAEWLSPKKNRLNKLGIEPDIKVVDKEETKNDEVIDRALRELKTMHSLK
ncbi:MAG: S41 family peptidase [Candidatus Peregrinibacteria bacterium]|nr:S41 family peptidase [Candidatus Peregrinibacteria bacterium]MDZ4245245.1 S41 family peptidase [Candidatus Gracilibacteria bacterium]